MILCRHQKSARRCPVCMALALAWAKRVLELPPFREKDCK